MLLNQEETTEVTSLRIGAVDWTVEIGRLAGALVAETVPEEATICISSELPVGRRLPLLLHEILEVIRLDYDEALDIPHEYILILSNVLAQVLADNLAAIAHVCPDLEHEVLAATMAMLSGEEENEEEEEK